MRGRIFCYVLAFLLAILALFVATSSVHGQGPMKTGYVCADGEVQYVPASGKASWVPKGPVSYVEGTLKPASKVVTSADKCGNAAPTQAAASQTIAAAASLGPLPTPFVGGPTVTPIPHLNVIQRDVPQDVVQSSDDWTLYLGLVGVLIPLVIFLFRRR